MINKNQDQKLYFSGDKDPLDIISEILEKNSLKETIQDALDKTKQGKISRVEILYKLTKKLAMEKISEKDFVSSIQKQLEITVEIAENLNKNIKEKLLPLATKINIGEEIEGSETEKLITVNPIRLITEKNNTEKEIFFTTKLPEKEKLKITKKPPSLEVREKKEIKNPNKKQDSYLEPIE